MNAKDRSTEVRYRALLQLLRTADSLWNASRGFFSNWDLSPSQFNIINLLRDRPEGFSQIELGRLLITHRSNVTGLVDRLEKRGLVRRREVAGDRRAYRVVLTPGGAKLLAQILPEYYRLTQEIWGDISAARAQQLVSDLEQLSLRAGQLLNPHEQT